MTKEISVAPYQVCTRCVMDTSDAEIVFNPDGVCNHCLRFDKEISTQWFPGPDGSHKWEQILLQVKLDGKKNEYDCILGLSGGLDSSLLALRVKEWGLRVLAVHVDAGWNSELAVFNIQQIVQYCDFDLHTIVIDWSEMRDLQVAYLRSGVSNQDVPQDHAFFASLYAEATHRNIHYILSGGNIATESIFPKSWHGNAMDRRSLMSINKHFGNSKLRSFPTIGFLRYYVINPYFYRLKVLRPLNYMPYDRHQALLELEDKVGYKDYGKKHGESLFTRFFQNYLLPKRFGYDKRRPHLSSGIMSGQITRDEALQNLDQPLYKEADLLADTRYFNKKLRLATGELEELINLPLRYHSDYKNQTFMYEFLRKLKNAAERVFHVNLSTNG
jgi:aminotransferase